MAVLERLVVVGALAADHLGGRPQHRHERRLGAVRPGGRGPEREEPGQARVLDQQVVAGGELLLEPSAELAGGAGPLGDCRCGSRRADASRPPGRSRASAARRGSPPPTATPRTPRVGLVGRAPRAGGRRARAAARSRPACWCPTGRCRDQDQSPVTAPARRGGVGGRARHVPMLASARRRACVTPRTRSRARTDRLPWRRTDRAHVWYPHRPSLEGVGGTGTKGSSMDSFTPAHALRSGRHRRRPGRRRPGRRPPRRRPRDRRRRGRVRRLPQPDRGAAARRTRREADGRRPRLRPAPAHRPRRHAPQRRHHARRQRRHPRGPVRRAHLRPARPRRARAGGRGRRPRRRAAPRDDVHRHRRRPAAAGRLRLRRHRRRGRARARRAARRRPRRPPDVGARGEARRSTTRRSRTAPTTWSPWSPRRWRCSPPPVATTPPTPCGRCSRPPSTTRSSRATPR